MKILVTGHNGYIGSVMVPILKRAGHEVFGLDAFYFSECTLKGEIPVDWFTPSCTNDLRDVGAFDLECFDAVIHLAALSNDPMGDLNAELTDEINCRASRNLAQLAKQASVKRFLYSSSCSMYGASSNELATEESPLHPLSAYAQSKVDAERGISALADDSFSPVFLRNATAYGVSPRFRADIVLNNLVAWAYTTGKIKILSDGTPWRPIVHIEDISRAFLACLEAPVEVIHNQAFNVGRQGCNFTVRELAKTVQQVVPNCDIEILGKGEPDPRNYKVDFGKLHNAFPDLGMTWKVRYGVEELADAYREHGLSVEDFTGRRFTRLKQLKHLIDTQQIDKNLRWAKEPAA